MIDVIWGSTTKPESSKRLAEALSADRQLEGTLYVGYPILGGHEGPLPIDALFLSPQVGLFAFDLVEGKSAAGYEERQDDIYARLKSRLLQYRQLVARRELAVDIQTVTYAPAAKHAAQEIRGDWSLTDDRNVLQVVRGGTTPDLVTYAALVAAVQAVSTIRRGRRRRETLKADSRGSKLKRVEDTIANLDSQQSAAVIETVEGVQRIRGLAGSGKTIVLALKVAYLHSRNPDWNIAVTFNTRSLKSQFERLITSFVIEQTSEEPDWERVRIIHAWGAPGEAQKDGIYFQFCKDNGVDYYDFRAAASRFGYEKAFEGACEEALLKVSRPVQKYDAILVDEAQDFRPSFLRLCYAFLKDPKRLVYAYDELQDLTGNSLPPPEELFGQTADGVPLVKFESAGEAAARQDIILEKCYRNSRPLLATAHALGFGIYRRPAGLIQIFDQKELWLDIGYKVVSGELADGASITLARTAESSPRFLEDHSPVNDLIQFMAFKSDEEQREWLVSEIRKNVTEDELQPDDIVVINPDPLKTRAAVGGARSRLFQFNINSSLAGVSGSPDVFFEPDTVTFTGIFRAKGNEAGMVYVINAHDCYSAALGADLARARNQLFTAITRSKAWVRVLGVGESMQKLAEEFAAVAANDFALSFRYPTEQERAKLRIVNRELPIADRRRKRKHISDLSGIVEAIKKGELTPEELPEEMLAELQQLIKKGRI